MSRTPISRGDNDVSHWRCRAGFQLSPPKLRPSSTGESVTFKGTVKFFNETKGYGFLTRDDGYGDVFVHRTDLPMDVGLLYEGQAVTFEVQKTKRGQRAINIAVA